MGLRKSVFGVASGLVGLLRTRLELLALEAADEKARLLKLLGMAFAALLFLTLAVLVFTVSIAVAFWPTENRYLALGLLAGLYAVLCGAAGRGQAGAALWPAAVLGHAGRAGPRRGTARARARRA